MIMGDLDLLDIYHYPKMYGLSSIESYSVGSHIFGNLVEHIWSIHLAFEQKKCFHIYSIWFWTPCIISIIKCSPLSL